jgi:hypothetical protein
MVDWAHNKVPCRGGHCVAGGEKKLKVESRKLKWGRGSE